MRALSLGHLTVADATPLELAEAAARAGFQGIAPRITGFAPGDAYPSLVEDAAARRAFRAAASGLRITSFCAYRLAPDLDPTSYEAVFAACAEIGADTLLATCFIPDPGEAAALLARLVEMAQAAGMRVGLELMRSSTLRDLPAAEALRRRIGSADVGHIIDALHLHRAGGTPAEVAALPPASLFGVQICDGPLMLPGGEDALSREVRARQLPGHGELPLHALLEAVPASLPVEVEAPEAALADRPVAERAARAYVAAAACLAAMD